VTSGNLDPPRALQHRPGDSLLHRLMPWHKLAGAMAVGALALLVDDVRGLLALLVAIVLAYRMAGLSRAELWRDLRWLLLQGALVVGLTLLLRGAGALQAGVRTALQLVLVFLPMALVLRTTSVEAMLDDLEHWLPDRIAFAIGATLRFVPVFARESGELIEMQRLRGARLTARDAWRPGAWRDWLACIALPMTLRAIEIASEAADAATIRGLATPTDR
jgi:energy-coupling factor transport system permease protein